MRKRFGLWLVMVCAAGCTTNNPAVHATDDQGSSQTDAESDVRDLSVADARTGARLDGSTDQGMGSSDALMPPMQDQGTNDSDSLTQADTRVSPPDARIDGDGSVLDPDGSVVSSDVGVSDPRNVDNDHDRFTENQGDCDDHQPTVYPNAPEVCDDGLDNDCDGRADAVDPFCRNVRDTVVIVETQGAPRAMIVAVESFNRARDLGAGWQASEFVMNESLVTVRLPAGEFPPAAFCGLRIDVLFFTDQDDVNADGEIIGEPNGTLCHVNEQGLPLIDMTIRRIAIEVAGGDYDAGDLVPVMVPGDPACYGLLVLNDGGACHLN